MPDTADFKDIAPNTWLPYDPSWIAWCDRSSDEMGKGVLNVHDNTRLTTPLASYLQ